MKLQGKTAIITGGGRDIGRACVMRLADRLIRADPCDDK